MERGSLTKVSKDFFTTVEGELSLSKGDYFLIHDAIDKHWYYGESRDKRGKFPSYNLYKVDLPDIQETDELFVSIASFSGEQSGDLAFGEGELIVGNQQVETNWYSGRIDTRSGIFPLTHVWRLDSSILKKATQKKTVRRKARVKTSLTAQLDEELDLREGETVTVLEILEDGWLRGKREDGREGMFPAAYVNYVENADERDSATVDPFPNSVFHDGKPIYKDFGEKYMPQLSAEEPAPNYYDLFPDTASGYENSHEAAAFENLSEIGAKFENPSEILQNGNELGNSSEVLQKFDHLDDASGSSCSKIRAITLYPFKAQFPNELSFDAGQLLYLTKRPDGEWAEGTCGSEKGYFPISYVEITSSSTEFEPKNQNDAAMEEKAPEEARGESEVSLKVGMKVKVGYNFQAQMDGDLSVSEDETVTVIEMANEDWVSVKNAEGIVGLCPRAYLSVAEGFSDPENDLESFEVVEHSVVMRNDPGKIDVEEEKEQTKEKRLSEPHRPAPPAPAPGRIPLVRPPASPQPQSSDVSATEREKRADKRQNVISELVITEKEYVRDLKLTYETFNLYNPRFLESRGIDVGTLFGNLLEIIHVAEELLDLVLRAMKDCDEDQQTIAPCFLSMTDKLQSAYEKYCGNHEAALALLKKYEDNREIMNIFDKGIETLKRQVICFDMNSILIKPVQRILKYPLMLSELIKCTEDSHPDKKGIEDAWKAMTKVASHINEYKRRMDLVSKYRYNDSTLMRKWANFNMHSMAKKSSRLSAKLSASLGVTNLSGDPEFDELERQFKSLGKSTLQLLEDAEQCVQALDEETTCADHLSNHLIQFYTGTADQEIQKYAATRVKIQQDYLKNAKKCITQRVNAPVNSLIVLLKGPAALIDKRADKLCDYDNAISRSEKNKDSRAAQELDHAKTNYEALNQQLIEELPILIEAATSLLVNCIGAFANTRKLLNGKITGRYLTLSASATLVSPQDVFESFLVNHNLIWNQISRNTFAAVNARIAETSATSVSTVTNPSPQKEEEKLSLMRRYTSEHLYIAKENVSSSSPLELALAAGSLVAVIKKQDPMGDSSRWFVDNGISQGFVPRRCLKQFSTSQNVNRQLPRSIDFTDSGGNAPDLICLDSPERMQNRNENLQNNLYMNLQINDRRDNNENTGNANTDSRDTTQHYQNVAPEFYCALYDFEQTVQGTLSVKAKQTLKLIRPCDKTGNDAWWLMEDRSGNKGYVPRNYLTPYSRAN